MFSTISHTHDSKPTINDLILNHVLGTSLKEKIMRHSSGAQDIVLNS